MTRVEERVTAVGTEALGPHHDALDAAWRPPAGWWGAVCAVNHKSIGRRFMITAFVYLLVGGVLALMIRTQLAVPENQLLGNEAYNQTFTMHGTIMMFLFAVPFLEGLSMYLVPLMIGSRDLPFPRLNAFGYWAYLFGGLFVLASLFTGEVPDGGWFAYVPLTSGEFSPGRNLDFWLLGVTFVEVAGIVGAIEILVGVARHRAPGMSLARMPLFVWSALAMAVMMLFAFTTLATASALLEIERAYDLPFFDPDRGGDPLLWQHLFWIFGHPEVYIIFLPAAGVASAVISASVQRPVVAYRWIVLSIVAISFLSFGLWVHHMFATGIPFLGQSFFAAASMMIAIPSGILVFSWIGTIWLARSIRWTTAMLFVVGFIAMFVAGGITGVMVAMVPFDWQAHDSHFVVAHFHYVLVGGAVFPIFAALHHWWPKIVGSELSARLGRATFWTMFVGFNITFFPQHIVGLAGMPRRVATYERDLGWGEYNLVSTAGSYLLGIGVLLFVVNALRSWRARRPVPADPWGGETLEWASASPPPQYNFETLPVVEDRSPMWNPAVADGELLELQEQLRTPHQGRRETWATSPVDAEPEEVVFVAGPSGAPLFTALGILVVLTGFLLDDGWTQLAGAVLALGAVAAWIWPTGVEVEREIVPEERHLEAPAPARRPHVFVSSIWGAALGITVAAVALAALVYTTFLLMADAHRWPPSGAPPSGLVRPGLAAGLLAVATIAVVVVTVRRPKHSDAAVHAALAVATVAALAAAVLAVIEIDAVPGGGSAHAYQASMVALLAFSTAMAVLATFGCLLVLALSFTRRLRRDPGLALQILSVVVAGSTVLAVAAIATIVIGSRVA